MFGTNLRELRRRAGLTQEALAEEAGVSTETVSRVERGAFEPSLSTAVALARALGVGIARLVGEETGAGRRLAPRARALAGRLEHLGPGAQRTLLALADRLSTPARKRR